MVIKNRGKVKRLTAHLTMKMIIFGGVEMESNMEELALEARRRYHREWCAKNKDKVREAHKRYWAKKAAALAAEQKGEADDERKGDQ